MKETVIPAIIPLMGNHYKDSLFRSLFSDKQALLELYNSIKGTQYDEQTELIINTLPETLFTHQRNDVSFLIDRRLVLLAEHQSTINENMPYRFLLPMAHVFENGITDKRLVYRQKLMKLPRPEFLVLYNGTAPYPDEKELRLSDAFMDVEGYTDIRLELTVKVYNINKGHNEQLVEKSEVLSGYVVFVDRVRIFHKQAAEEYPGMREKDILTIAIARAIEYCKAHGILTEFWEGLSNEEVNMLTTEWDLDTALAVRWEEGREDGIEEGREEGMEKEREAIIRNAAKAGLSFDIIQQITGVDKDTIIRFL
ncbi:RpnC/YadD family protein [Breznakiellaceae bacterium SP9]